MLAKISKIFETSSRTVNASASISIISVISTFSLQLEFFQFSLIKAIISSLISWVWLTILLISTIHIWQGKHEQRLGLITYLILVPTTLSALWLFTFYPGVISNDSLAEWQSALKGEVYDWFPPVLAFLMLINQTFSKTPSLLIFLQCLIFWLSILYLNRQMFKNNKWFLINSTIIIFVPPLWLYSHAMTSNAWMSSFILFSIAFLLKSYYSHSKAYFSLSVLALSCAFLFRRDAILFIPSLIIIYLFLFRQNRPNFLVKVQEILLIILIVILPAKILGMSTGIISGYNPSAHGIFNRYVGTVVHSMNSMSQSEFESERRSINNNFRYYAYKKYIEADVFQELIDKYRCDFSNYITWPLDKNPVLDGIPKEKNKFIIRKVISVAIRHPLGFMKHQTCYFYHLGQVENIYYQKWTNFDDWRSDLGLEFKSKLPSVKSSYERITKYWFRGRKNMIFRHYIFIFFLMLSLLIGLLRQRIELTFTALFALGYFLGFWMLGPAPLWRYLLICYICSWLCLLKISNHIIVIAMDFLIRLGRFSKS